MIELITGLPGNGKTLFTIGYVKAWAEAEGRPVFYHGIPELALPWTAIDDPTKWMEVPPKSIVIIDEAQKTFRNRSLGAVPPKHVTDLETHRHLGIDLVIITQHPSLIDPAVRRLAGRHQHMVRIWGMEASTVHKWDAVKDNCDKPAGRKDSEHRKWPFDKSLYGLYKSAEVHTMKRSIPGRVKVLIALFPLLLLAIAGAVYSIRKTTPTNPAKVVSSGSAAPGMLAAPVAGGQSAGVRGGYQDPVEDLKQYVWKETPRVAALPQTAPKYDELTKPTRVPIPAMCIQIGVVGKSKDVTCRCWTQQATPMPSVPLNMCMEFARNGYFREFDPDRDRQAVERTERGAAALDRRPDGPVPVQRVDEAPAGHFIPGEAMGPARTDKSPPMVVSGVIQDGPPNNRATRAAAGAGV
jgi:zona occludens toxin